MKAFVTWTAVLMLACCAGCGEKEEAVEDTGAQPPAKESGEVATAVVTAPVLTELKNATYHGIEEHGPITLKDGLWEGEPFAEGAASHPRVEFLRDFHRLGDLSGDGQEEAAVLLAANSGGTGQNIYLAVLGMKGGKLENLDTALIGDRVQVRKAGILEGRLFMDILRAGKGDAMSNPGELDVLAWTLENDKLAPMGASSKPLRLTFHAVVGNQWVLKWWGLDELAPAAPEVVFEFKEGKLAGKSGCNSFFTEPKHGQAPGEISFGPTGGTMMMCEDDEMEVERRFLTQLEAVNKFGYLATMLALSYEINGEHGVMLFERRDAE